MKNEIEFTAKDFQDAAYNDCIRFVNKELKRAYESLETRLAGYTYMIIESSDVREKLRENGFTVEPDTLTYKKDMYLVSWKIDTEKQQE